MEQENVVKRRFSLEEDFMNYKVDDLLFGFMRSLSTARPIYENGKIVKWEEYLLKKELVKNKKIIAQVCGYTTRTLNRHVEQLAEQGLIEEQVKVIPQIDKNGNETEYEYECYVFPSESKRYKLVEKELLTYLIRTRTQHAIKVYLYLLNKYEWKKTYNFTIKEIQQALGYAESSIIDDLIGAILESLNREGIINFEESYEYRDNYKVPMKVLKFVAKSKNELR